MTIRFVKAQKINGVEIPADVIVFGLESEVEARAMEGGGAEIFTPPVSGGGISTEGALIAALAVGGLVTLAANATISLTQSHVIKSGTTLDLNGGTLRLANAVNKSPLKNEAFDAVPVAVTITSVGRTATAVWATPHGKNAGDPVSILGADQGSYNGVWEVATVVDPNTLTYVMFEPASASPATGGVTGRACDTNIVIVNGTVDGNEQNQTVSGNNETHAVRIFNCLGGRIDLAVNNAKKYACLLANVDRFDVPYFKVDTASDGLHIMGPAGTINVGVVEGRSGDDLFAITLGDFATYEVCRGNARNITVQALKPRYALTAFKLAGNPGCTAEFVKIGSISGTTRRQAIYITNDLNLTQTNSEYIEIGPLRVTTGQESASTYQGIQIRGGTHKHIKIGAFHDLTTDTTDAISLADATFGKVEIDAFYSRNTVVKKHVNVGGTATFQKWLSIRGIDATPGDSALVALVSVGGTANISKLVLSGEYAVAVGTNARSVQVLGTTATVSEVCYDAFRLLGGNSFYDQAVAGQPAVTIKMYNGTRGSGYATGLNLRGDATVMLSEMDWGAFTNRPISTGNAGTVDVIGSAKKLAARMINRGVGSTVYVSGHTLVCDVASHQNGRTGDSVTDVVSGKVVMYDGAAWTAVA